MGETAAKYKILSRNNFKAIAIVTMVIDHTAITLSNIGVLSSNSTLFFIMRSVIGRFAWPIFALLLIEGLFLTSHPGRHVLTLLATAIVAEPCYDLMTYGTLISPKGQNIIWIYVLAAVFIFLLRNPSLIGIQKIIVSVLCGAASIAAAQIFNLSGGWSSCAGLLLGALIFMYMDSYMLTSCMTGIAWGTCNMNPFALVPIAITALYNPKKECRHNSFLKYFGYAFYPGHLLILGLIRIICS